MSAICHFCKREPAESQCEICKRWVCIQCSGSNHNCYAREGLRRGANAQTASLPLRPIAIPLPRSR